VSSRIARPARMGSKLLTTSSPRAQETGAAVLHYDRDYDTLAEIMAFKSIWLAAGLLPQTVRVLYDRIAPGCGISNPRPSGCRTRRFGRDSSFPYETVTQHTEDERPASRPGRKPTRCRVRLLLIANDLSRRWTRRQVEAPDRRVHRETSGAARPSTSIASSPVSGMRRRASDKLVGAVSDT
jgi:hypothetical protein